MNPWYFSSLVLSFAAQCGASQVTTIRLDDKAALAREGITIEVPGKGEIREYRISITPKLRAKIAVAEPQKATPLVTIDAAPDIVHRLSVYLRHDESKILRLLLYHPQAESDIFAQRSIDVELQSAKRGNDERGGEKSPRPPVHPILPDTGEPVVPK